MGNFDHVLTCSPNHTQLAFSSSMWGVSASKIPQRAVGTVMSALVGVVRNTQGGHQGKGGRRTLAIDCILLERTLSYRACTLSRIFSIN